jgi:protein SCO1
MFPARGWADWHPVAGARCAAVIAGLLMAAPTPVLAQHSHAQATTAPPLVLAHAGHERHGQAEMKTGDYSRSLRTYAVPDITLVDRNSQSVRLRDLLAADEPVMMNFIFTTCTTICPVMSSIFSKVPGELGAGGAKLRMISISIDPENDTPAQLNAYAKKLDAGPRWQFLTGSAKDVAAVQRAFDNYRADKMEHEPLTLLRSAPGEPWVRIEGFASPEDLAREYRKVASRQARAPGGG